MLTFFLFLTALGFIWDAYGFWMMLTALLLQFLMVIFNPPNSNVPWGSRIGQVLVIVMGVFAVELKWDEPAYTAAAVSIAIILIAMDLKN